MKGFFLIGIMLGFDLGILFANLLMLTKSSNQAMTTLVGVALAVTIVVIAWAYKKIPEVR